MMKYRVSRLATWSGLCAVLLFSAGCISSKPYTLVAQLAPPSSQSGILAATIDVNGAACTVRVMIAGSDKAWTPVCLVLKNQSGFKSFTIDGTQVDFGAVANGFKVLSATLPTLPGPDTSPPATTAPATSGNAAGKPPAGQGAATAPPAPTATAAPVTFPDQWSLAPYPGTLVLQGQDPGFLITSTRLSIHGSEGTLDVTYKTASYAPLHLVCTVITNAHGDYSLIFNPAETSRLTGGGNGNIQLVSEGASITGSVWDSHGFDSWTPGLPPRWATLAPSSN